MTFSKDVAPIINKNCAPCHRPEEAGPFNLLTYEDVRTHARQIVTVTASRFMPPWLPEPGYGDFAGERRLTSEEIATLARWVAQGEAEGDSRDLPPAPRFTPGWQLGKPDLVLTMAQPYHLAATGVDVYRNFIVPATVTTTRYVKAIEIRPGNPKALHHANILVDPNGSCRRLEGHPGDGFSGMDVRTESESFDPESHFLFWKPGSQPYVEPDGRAWALKPGTDLVLNMHMQPTGKPETLQASVGLYFTDMPPVYHPMLLQLERDGKLDIPAGDPNFTVTDSFTLPLDVEVLGVYPHAHYLGTDLEGWATRPDGSREWLIWIKHWNLDWQGVYRYKRPVVLPRGSVLHMRYTYDNTERNPRNPFTPPRRVVAGNRATDEMGHLWVQVLPRQAEIGGKDSRIILQEAMMRHWLAKYPDDFVAHYNLASALASEGKLDEAVTNFAEAARAQPTDATAENGWGAALEAQGNLSAASAHYREALRLEPDDPDALYNLGNCLLQRDDFAAAAEQFRRLVQLRPDDSGARGKLARALGAAGTVLAGENRLDDAIRDFRESLALAPDSADAYNNLGGALARKGELAEAETDFERALQLNPGHSQARNNLRLVREEMTRQAAPR
ncbi:MAG TPA: tetratricopeptide repeat protein [Terriglobia bacterium]|nr:tetratricopeptide repeat protein [Terriglobia bacterium]